MDMAYRYTLEFICRQHNNISTYFCSKVDLCVGAIISPDTRFYYCVCETKQQDNQVKLKLGPAGRCRNEAALLAILGGYLVNTALNSVTYT